MKKTNMILSAVFALVAPALSAAAHDIPSVTVAKETLRSVADMPVVKRLVTSSGTLSIRGSFSQGEYGVAVQLLQKAGLQRTLRRLLQRNCREN